MAVLTRSLCLLIITCNYISCPLSANYVTRAPGPLVSRGNIRKTMKPCTQQRQVSALLLLAILLAGDVHCNPGPHRQISTYPCGMCDKDVSCTDCVACDNCSVWYHRSCLEMCTADFQHLQHSTASWACFKCDSMNCTSFTFHSYCLVSNVYDPLTDLSVDSFQSQSHRFSPLKTSSPKKLSTPLAETNSNRPQPHPTIPIPLGPQERTQSALSCGPSEDSTPLFPSPAKQNLRLLNVNCRSVLRNRAEFLATIDFTKPDVVCGTESWLGPDTKSSEAFPPDYVAYRRDRGTIAGGVFVLVHKTLVSSAAPELQSDCEMTWAKIHLERNNDLLVGCFYMPHRSPKDLAELDKTLQKITGGQKRQQVLLAGDFNCPNIDWETTHVAPNAPDRQVQIDLVDVCIAAQLTQIHDQPTRGDNILDLVFTTNPSLAKSSTSIPGISDHHAVVTDFDTRPQRVKDKPRRVYLYSKAKWGDLNADLDLLSNKINTMNGDGANVDSMWTELKTTVMSAAEKHIPSKLRRRNSSLPWINWRVKKLLRRKKRLYKQAKKTGNWRNYKFHQQECRRAARRAEWEYVNTTIEEGLKTNDSKPFWRYVKSRRQDNLGVAPLKKGSSLVSDSLTKAQILLTQFRSVFTKEDGAPPPEIKDPPYPPIKTLTIDTNGVTKLLKNLNSSKASGPDHIPNKILKNCAESIAPALTTIFNRSLETGELPADWLSANISAVFKKGDRNRAENYRPVSLTSVACKLLEHIICHHLRNHLEMYNILTDRNHGFRSGHSCETQLLTTTNDLLESYDARTQVDIAILDYEKAFDTVPHAKLMQKMDHYGVRGPIHVWLTNFLTRRTMRVVVEGEASEEAAVRSGVPQGTVLGPLLFLCHINDLPQSVESTVRLFADDCLLYREIHTFQDHLDLQADLKQLEVWAKKWGMRFNAHKCYILSTRNRSSYLYTLDGVILQQVQHSPYLGILLSADLKWSSHIANICRKAGSTVGFLRRNLRNCPQECRRLAYISLVRSSLEYGATVWDPYHQQDIERLERVQRQAARFITRDYKSRSSGCVSTMLKDLNLPPLEERRRQLRLTLLNKIAEGLIPALPPDKFLTPAVSGRRRVVPTRFQGYDSSNVIKRQAVNNARGFRIPTSKTAQYKNSFFVRSVAEWNQLSDTDLPAIPAQPAGRVSSSPSTSGLPPLH